MPTYEEFAGDEQAILLGSMPVPDAGSGVAAEPLQSEIEQVFEVKLPAEPIRIMSPQLRYPGQASRFVMEVGEVADDEHVDSSPIAETAEPNPIHEELEKPRSVQPPTDCRTLAEAISEGERAIAEGRTRPARDVFAEMKAKYGF